MILLFVLLSSLLTAPPDMYPGWEQFENFKGYPPYCTEFGYRTIADHVIDANHPQIDPSKVQLGDIVYVGVWYLNWFQDYVHDKIANPYILVTCDLGGYLPNPGLHKLIFDPKVACWFGKNILFTNHPKFHQLPMGQFYHQWMISVGNDIPFLNDLVRHLPEEKDIFLYLNYTDRDYGRRNLVTEKFYNKPYCFNRNRPRKGTPFQEYWSELARSKFVLSPLGMEVDCTRTWESFILGAIPIVEHSFLDPLYEKLPILLIHDWDQINEDYLNRKYDEIQKQPKEIERAYLDYWIALMKEKQARIRQGDLSMSSLETTLFSAEDLHQIKMILTQHKKLTTPLIYRGNLTTLRSYQLSQSLPTIASVTLLDVWTIYGVYSNLSFKNHRVKPAHVVDTDALLAKPNKTVFLDLTHFKHKLFKTVADLDDFAHSLEADIRGVYQKLLKGEIIIGNRANDAYVNEVLNRLAIPYEITGDFFVLKK